MKIYCPTCGTEFEYFEDGYGHGQELAHCHKCQRDWLFTIDVVTRGTTLRTDVSLAQYAGRCSCCGS